MESREDVSASRTKDLHSRFPVRIRILSDNKGREQVNRMQASCAKSLHYPKVIQHIANFTHGISRTIEASNLLADVTCQSCEGIYELGPLHGAEGNLYRLGSNGIDVSPKAR
jgi:hypothetical protein